MPRSLHMARSRPAPSFLRSFTIVEAEPKWSVPWLPFPWQERKCGACFSAGPDREQFAGIHCLSRAQYRTLLCELQIRSRRGVCDMKVEPMEFFLFWGPLTERI